MKSPTRISKSFSLGDIQESASQLTGYGASLGSDRTGIT